MNLKVGASVQRAVRFVHPERRAGTDAPYLKLMGRRSGLKWLG